MRRPHYLTVLARDIGAVIAEAIFVASTNPENEGWPMALAEQGFYYEMELRERTVLPDHRILRMKAEMLDAALTRFSELRFPTTE